MMINNVKKTSPLYIRYIYLIWALFMLVAVILTFTSVTQAKCRYYDEKIAASELTQQCFDKIKEYKINNGIGVTTEDINNTGMLGSKFSYITTTTGILESKRTSINPNFAAVIIDMFKEANIKKGDQVVAVFSGSFPALNIAVLCAIQTFELDPLIMASIGASTWGANQTEFTFYDMAEYLCSEGILNHRIDYVSLGGSSDMGYDFWENASEPILARISENGTKLISESDFNKNLELRMDIIAKSKPNLKLFINVGGNLISMGCDEEAYIANNGLIKPSYLNNDAYGENYDKKGLIENYLMKGIPVIHMLNIKKIALKYGLPYDPTSYPEVGIGNVYYEETYHLVIPIIAVLVSIGLLVFIFIIRKKEKINE